MKVWRTQNRDVQEFSCNLKSTFFPALASCFLTNIIFKLEHKSRSFRPTWSEHSRSEPQRDIAWRTKIVTYVTFWPKMASKMATSIISWIICQEYLNYTLFNVNQWKMCPVLVLYGPQASLSVTYKNVPYSLTPQTGSRAGKYTPTRDHTAHALRSPTNSFTYIRMETIYYPQIIFLKLKWKMPYSLTFFAAWNRARLRINTWKNNKPNCMQRQPHYRCLQMYMHFYQNFKIYF